MDEQARSPLRLLAPAALGLFALLLLIVIVASIVGGSSGSTEAESQGSSQGQASQPSSRRGRRGRGSSSGTYTVKEGDTLGGIAQETDRTPEQLQEFNPGLDPQALQSGQKLKLRE